MTQRKKIYFFFHQSLLLHGGESNLPDGARKDWLRSPVRNEKAPVVRRIKRERERVHTRSLCSLPLLNACCWRDQQEKQEWKAEGPQKGSGDIFFSLSKWKLRKEERNKETRHRTKPAVTQIIYLFLCIYLFKKTSFKGWKWPPGSRRKWEP